MKPIICIVFILMCICDADEKVGSDLVRDESRKEEYDRGYYNGEDDRGVYSDRDVDGNDYDEDYDSYFDKNKGLYVGNPDDFGRIERPCKNYDIYCIRRFFTRHAQCKIAQGPVPDPLYRAQNTVYLPRLNISGILNQIEVRGLNGRISEFYVNKVTDNLVIAIEFTNLNVSIPTQYFEFFRNAMEPVVTLGNAIVPFPSLVVTAVIPNIDDLQLQKAEVTVFANDAFPPFMTSPSNFASADPQTAQAFVEFIRAIPVDVQEFLFTEGPFYAASYIQYNICDFGLKIF